MTFSFKITPHPSPVSQKERQKLLADPGFGTIFTDHMAVINYTEGKGWHDPRVEARAPIPMDPATSVLHYAQEIFEGLKAYKLEDGGAALFRPDANARRFQDSARRMAMPQLPDALFLGSIEALVNADRDWIPPGEGTSLYLRPFMFASEVFLAARPAREYMFVTIASAAGAYFKGGPKAISIWASENYSRAAPGGTGAAKCGGNYAAGMAAQIEASEQGCDQVVFLDAAERKWVEELGGMNLFFVMGDGRIVTPPLTGTILPGITRDSLITLARDEGLEISEEPYGFDQWHKDAISGKLRETFACGTAAVVTAVGTVKSAKGAFTIGTGDPGQITEKMRNRLVDIQRGTAPDPHGWVKRLF